MSLRIFHTLTFTIIVVTILFAFSGCSSLAGYGNILHGPVQGIQIFSEPDGAIAEIDGNMRVMTPNVVTLKRKSNHQTKIEKDEYETFVSLVNRRISGAIILDIYYDPIGSITDLALGGGYNLSPKVVNVKLQKKEGIKEESDNKENFMALPFLPVEEDINTGKHPEVTVNTKSKRGVVGKLWKLQDNSILIQPLSWKEEPVSIDLNSISQIELRKKVYSRSGLINGAIIGFLDNTFITTGMEYELSKPRIQDSMIIGTVYFAGNTYSKVKEIEISRIAFVKAEEIDTGKVKLVILGVLLAPLFCLVIIY